MKKLDLVGKQFGNLTAIKIVGKTKQGSYIWECKCKCGNKTQVVGARLKNGHTKSCGCLVQKNHFKTHLKTNTRIYRIYWAMKNRCYNPNVKFFKDYGGRGITVCDEWLGENGFISFYKWAMENGYRDDLSIDRIDNNGGYSPNNCRWATRLEQAINQRRIKYYEYDNQRYDLMGWSRILNINYNTLRSRILELNWSIEKAFNKKKVCEK